MLYVFWAGVGVALVATGIYSLVVWMRKRRKKMRYMFLVGLAMIGISSVLLGEVIESQTLLLGIAGYVVAVAGGVLVGRWGE